jgi:hypothetical protein
MSRCVRLALTQTGETKKCGLLEELAETFELMETFSSRGNKYFGCVSFQP